MGEADTQGLAFLKRYDRNTSAMSMRCSQEIPRVLKCSKDLRNRTPIVAPITKAVTPALLPIEFMLKENDIGDVSRRIILRRKEESNHTGDVEFPCLPNPLLVHENEFPDVLFQTVEACMNVMCDFSNPEHDVKAKEDKLAALVNLKTVLESPVHVKLVNYMHLREFMRMIEKHIDFERLQFRVLLLSCDWSTLEFCEPSWLHLSVVYQIFTQLVHVYKTQIAVSAKLLSRLVERMGSPDSRERECVSAFFCTYLKVFASQRNALVTNFVHKLVDYIETLKNPFVVPGILHLWRMFPKWFEEKVKRPLSILVPLCNSPHVTVFFSVAIPVLILYGSTPEHKEELVQILVREFPAYPVESQIVRILIICKLLEQLTPAEFAVVNKSVISFLRTCATCESAKVIQSSFNLWNNHKITSLFKPFAKSIQAELYSFVVSASISHWCPSVRGSAKFVLKAIQRLSGDEFEIMHKTKRPTTKAVTSSKWNRVLRAAAANDPEFAEIRTVKSYEIDTLFEEWDRPAGVEDLIRYSF